MSEDMPRKPLDAAAQPARLRSLGWTPGRNETYKPAAWISPAAAGAGAAGAHPDPSNRSTS